MQESWKVKAVTRAAEQAGLLAEKGIPIAARVSIALIRQAKRQTGIKSDTDLIVYALATVVLEGGFARAFEASRGKVDPALRLGY